MSSNKITLNTSISEIVEHLGNAGIDLDVEKYVPLSELSEIVQNKYLSTLIWLILQNKGLKNQKYIANLNLLMTRIECPVTVRKETRTMLYSEEPIELTLIVQELHKNIKHIEKKAIKFSIVKDAIWLVQESEDDITDVRNNTAIKELCEVLAVTNDQVSVIIESSELDKKILAGEVDDSELKKMATGLAQSAASVGVPLTAVYMSGSVVGLSAAGITSGLAACGLGGVLGLSAMVTGIGVLLLLGVATYQGVKYISGSGEREKLSRRELMLHQILLMHQRTISNLAEDVFAIANELKLLLVDVEKNKAMIAKIVAHLSMAESVTTYIQTKERSFQDELKQESQGNS